MPRLWSNLSREQAGEGVGGVPIPGAEVGCRAPGSAPHADHGSSAPSLRSRRLAEARAGDL